MWFRLLFYRTYVCRADCPELAHKDANASTGAFDIRFDSLSTNHP